MRSWRVGHIGRDQMYYDELIDGTWQRLVIDGELLTGRAHHVIYFASPERWAEYPEWARDRRTQIIERIKLEFRPPDYEYYGLADTDAGAGCPAPEPRLPDPPAPQPERAARPQGWNALLLATVLVSALTLWMGRMVTDGVVEGVTPLPIKLSSIRRPVSRVQEPLMYWFCIGTYAAVGTGALVLSLLGWRELRRLAR